MGWDLAWIPLIAVAVWVISNIARSVDLSRKQQQQQGQGQGQPLGQGPPGPQQASMPRPRPRPAPSDIDRFLEEINQRRRQQQQQQRRPGEPVTAQPVVEAAPRPRRPQPVAPPRPRPGIPERPRPVRVEPPPPPVVVAEPIIVEAIPVEGPGGYTHPAFGKLETQLRAPAPAQPPPPPPAALSPSQRLIVIPAHLQLLHDLLHSKPGIQAGLVLNEVLGPPKSQRRR